MREGSCEANRDETSIRLHPALSHLPLSQHLSIAPVKNLLPYLPDSRKAVFRIQCAVRPILKEKCIYIVIHTDMIDYVGRLGEVYHRYQRMFGFKPIQLLYASIESSLTIVESCFILRIYHFFICKNNHQRLRSALPKYGYVILGILC